MKERPILFRGSMVQAILAGRKTQTRRIQKRIKHNPEGKSMGALCPYGKVGDRLWVRETFYPAFKRTENLAGCVYRADQDGTLAGKLRPDWSPPDGWKPSIFMPRWACRILLEVVEVRVHRLQDISKKDAEAEGVAPWLPCGSRTGTLNRLASGDMIEATHKEAFKFLWESIHQKKGEHWSDNPWLWAITFKRIEL